MTDSRIFLSGSGKVVAIDPGEEGGGNATTSLVSISGGTGNFDSKEDMPLIITSLRCEMETAQAFTRSLADVFYVYPFGDRPSAIEVRGLVIPNDLRDCGPTKVEYGTSLTKAHAYYLENRVRSDKITALNIQLGGGVSIDGLLVKMSIDAAVSAGQLPVVGVSFSLLGWQKVKER